MIQYYLRSIKDATIQEVEELKPGVWVHAEKPTDEELSSIAKLCELDESLLRDAVDVNEVPRLEVEEGSVYIYTRVPFKGEEPTMPLLIVVGKNNLVTIAPQAFSFFDKIQAGSVEFVTTQKAKCVVQLFSLIVSLYQNALTRIQKRVRLERVQLERANTQTIIQFLAYENTLNDYLSALVPTSAILNNLLAGKHLHFFEEDQDLVEDLQLAVGQLIESARANLKTIVNVRESYGIIMTTRLNETMRLLTSLTVLFTVPTMITSFFGMNIDLPLAAHPMAWVFILLMTLGGVLLVIWLFWRNRFM